MKKEYDFSNGERGKFYRPGTRLSIPVYLEPQVAEAVQKHARKKHTSVGSLVNGLLRREFRASRGGR